ncbi:hypothetical protein J1N35_025279 [Gossypium stocksii]|uniref:Uncharacterized protein n=1 Tax=Gossypium stocksii TaxID=47602 RepID=A0A9D3V7A6_9ROSI|nr:hypothetical protein J1N35_025279 [Gossypium stocksii]
MKERTDGCSGFVKKVRTIERVRKKACGSTEVELDGMFRWMQEMIPVLQEFVRINGLSEPNYPLDMFGPISAQHVEEGVGANFEEEGAAQEYPRMEDEYEATFQP